jgi:uncharacterized membrane-anchored protein YitT (DUF2179 family)
MITLQINNPDIENFIKSNYGVDKYKLISDFVSFIKNRFDSDRFSITSHEAKQRVEKAMQELENGSAIMLLEDEYNKEMQEFISTL